MMEKRKQMNTSRKPVERASVLSTNEKRFIRHALKYFGIRSIRIERSESKDKHPDIWVRPNMVPPTITVTDEWSRQPYHERMKRVVHELLHIRGLEHNDTVEYSTYPDKDRFSVRVYKDILAGGSRFSMSRVR